MSSVLSTIATLAAAALVKGPGRGSSAIPSHLKVLDDVAEVPVANPAIDVSEGDYIRFGVIPAGAKLCAALSSLVTNHTATIAGKLVLVPLDGSASTEITGVTVLLEGVAASGNSETLTIKSVPLAADSVSITKDSWIQFIPTSDLVIASSAKKIWARIAYGTLN